MITQELEENINFTHADARRRRLADVTIEHLVLVLIDNSTVRRCLAACNADIDSLRQDLEHFIESQVPPAVSGARPARTPEFDRVIKRAVSHVRPASRDKASGAHVLAAVFAEPDSRAAHFLCKHGVERLAVLAYAASQKRAAEAAPAQRSEEETDLVALASAGKIEQPFGRDREAAELARILSRKYKNSPLLVGEPGVGKTAVVHKLAHHAAEGRLPALAGFSLFSVSIGDLVAGTRYRGDFEQRMRQLLDKCRAARNAALFIDEIHTVVGAGAVSGGSLDAANMMKPLLGGGVRCIGATTFAEYRRIFEKDSALSRRFQKVEVREPAGEELDIIMTGVVGRLAAHHKVPYLREATGAAIKYARRLLPARFLPDKAIDLLDDAGSRRRAAGSEASIGDADIFECARAAAGLPASGGVPDIAGLEQHLAERVVAQPEAARLVAAAVRRRRLGYHDNRRAAGAFLFAGPTGVGKTEMARQLAACLGAPLLRFDMSEYMEQHAVSKLIGAPPGYVGFEQGGGLVEGVARHPESVVLLDEIEKAHPEVINVFLQIMDCGALTDGAGRRADFSNAIVIMTSNAGAQEWERPPPGFDRADADAAGAEAIARRFSPEFRNRLDAIARFMPLSGEALARILDVRLDEMRSRLESDKNIKAQVRRSLRDALIRDGFSPSMGARPLERLLRERVLDALAEAEAGGQLSAGSACSLEWDGERTVVNVRRAAKRSNAGRSASRRKVVH